MAKIAIITARGGSKRIPGKNIRPFLGKPIITYSISAAIESGIFDEVMVSTDDNEIAAIAKMAGAKVPFMRSAKTSDDFATSSDVLQEVFDEYRRIGKIFDHACCIYPTAPFVTAQKLQEASDILIEKKAHVVLPIAKFSVPVWWALDKNDFGIRLRWPENANKRSQDLPTSYYDAGQFYFFDVDKFLRTKQLFTDNTYGVEISELEVQDIDNIDDWYMAEIKYLHLLNRKNG
jgi:pseudaminic acid cytidylyltransferase